MQSIKLSRFIHSNPLYHLLCCANHYWQNIKLLTWLWSADQQTTHPKKCLKKGDRANAIMQSYMQLSPSSAIGKFKVFN